MKYAIISEGKVSDIIVWDSEEYPSFDTTFTIVRIPDNQNVLTGDIYDESNNTFVQTTPERTE